MRHEIIHAFHYESGLAENFENKPFYQREVAAAGYAASTSVYNSLYNKNIINKKAYILIGVI